MTIEQAKAKLAAHVAAQSTEMLIAAARANNSNTTKEGILASIAIDAELEKRLPEAQFVALMDELYAAM